MFCQHHKKYRLICMAHLALENNIPKTGGHFGQDRAGNPA